MIRTYTLLLLFFTTQVQAASWYVDNAATGSNNGTSWASAWNAFSRVVWGSNGVKAGDTLFISGGGTSKVYSGSSLVIGASGTSGSPIFIRPGQDSGHNGVAILSGAGGLAETIWWNARSYVRINGNTGGSRNLWLSGVTNASHTVGFGINGNVHNSIVEYVTVTNCNNGIMVGNGTGNVIRNNRLTYIKGDRAIDLNGSTGGYDANLVHDNFISNNTTSDRSGAGPDGIQGTSGVSVFNNYFVGVGNNGQVGGQHPDGIQMTRDHWKIYNNTFENFTDSSIDNDNWGNSRQQNNIRIYNNLFKITDPIFRTENRNPVGIRVYLPGGTITNIADFLIANNTFVDFPSRAMYWSQVDANCTFTNVKIVNNLFFNIGRKNYAGSQVFNFGDISSPILNSITTGNVQIDYNLFFPGANGVTMFQRSTVAILPANWGAGIQGNGVNADPMFLSYGLESVGNDLRFSSGSPARGRGVDLSVYFLTDKNGSNRSGAWDIGAYQYQDGAIAMNRPPVASGGLNQSITLPNNTVILAGSASDPDGNPLQIQWTQPSGPAAALLAPPTALSTTATFTIAGQYVFRLTVSDGSLSASSDVTVTVQPAGGGAFTSIMIEAESGTITAPFLIQSGSIVQNTLTTLAAGGRATYSFNVSTAGVYLVEVILNAPGEAANSLFFNIDAQPTDPATIWDIPITSGFERRAGAWRGAGTFDANQFTPKPFTLTAGTHTLTVIGREPGVQLDRFEIVRQATSKPTTVRGGNLIPSP